MLFNLKTALKIRDHYKDILINTTLPGSGENISGNFICREDQLEETLKMLLDVNFDNYYSSLVSNDDMEKVFEIYVYHWEDSGLIIHHELDKHLSQTSISKIY